MTQPHSPPPEPDRPQGFSYVPGGIAPVTGVPYPEGMGFVTPVPRSGRPGTLTAAVVLLWVLAGLTTLGALLWGLLVLLTTVQPVRGLGADTASTVIVGVLVVLLLLTYAGLMMVSAIRLPKRADSARVLALTLMGFFVFTNLSYIVLTVGGLSGSPAALGLNIIGIFLSLLVAAMPAVVIVLLSLKKSVTWFYDKSTPVK